MDQDNIEGWLKSGSIAKFFRLSDNLRILVIKEILQVKYLNNLIEQDHRFIKKITNPMMGLKAFHLAKTSIDGIETAHMIRKAAV